MEQVPWLYNDKPLTEAPSEYEGFVYLITDLDTGMKYVGKKSFWSRKTLPPLKGKKRKRKVIKESDWQSYWGSNPHLSESVENAEAHLFRFKREILHLCLTKGDASWYELKEQVDRDVLRDASYYNGIIQVRISTSHLSEKENATVLS